MTRLARYLKPYLAQLFILIVLIFVQVMANLQLPDYMARIINEGIIPQDNGLILNIGAKMLGVSFLGALAMVGVGVLASRIASGFSRDIRGKLFAQVERFSLAEFNQFSTASLITRSTNDIQQIQMVMVVLMRMVLQAPIMGTGAIYRAYHTAPSMSWIMGLAVLVLLGVIAILFSLALPRFQILQKLVDRLNLVTRENLTGLRVIRAFNREKYEEAKFERANQDLTNLNLFVNRLMVIMQPFMMLVFNFTALSVIWMGAHLISAGGLGIGNMIAFMQYSMQVIMSFLMVSIIFIMVPRASVSAGRVAEVIETVPSIMDPQQPRRGESRDGVVEFRQASFTYPGADKPALSNISFVAEPGKTTAIVGSTGSGKSTLLNLILRLYDTSNGQVLVDGTDVREYALEELYSRIGYVPQKAVLFSGTVKSNVTYGAPKAQEEEITRAIRIAQAEEFVEKLEEKTASPIAQGGTNVSGGQKQRLSIARAVARDPEIYLFDDSFSALDFTTDAKLRQALRSETKGKTVLIVAQRISTIAGADRIVVLDEGRVVGVGTHRELLAGCEVYREIAQSQLPQEELQSYLQLEGSLV